MIVALGCGMSVPLDHASARRVPLAPILASLAAALVVLGGALTGQGAGQTLVVAVTVGVLATLLVRAGRPAVAALPAKTAPAARAGDVDSSTAYWCALEAPTCPRRPRAPGRH